MNAIKILTLIGLAFGVCAGSAGCKTGSSSRETRVHAHRRSVKTPTTVRHHRLPPASGKVDKGDVR